ncbi:MAG: Four helix bundle protein [Phycisphaerales bacterium]|nr:Four helix bundle protein [Phycisphaerales bacterium]
MAQQDIGERLLNFAVRVGKVVDALPQTRMGRHVAGQLVRCGTSPCVPTTRKHVRPRAGPISCTNYGSA